MSWRKHQHNPGCRYQDLDPLHAWGKHLRNMLICWLLITVGLYGVIILLRQWLS